MTPGLLGAKANAPIASEAWSSVVGAQVMPLSRVSQMPPMAAPISQWALLVGSTAAQVIRPLTGPAGVICPFTIGAGPILTHCGPTPPTRGPRGESGLLVC